MLTVKITDKDLEELILTGKNKGKYKKYTHDRKFVGRLTTIYNLMKTLEHVSDLKRFSFLHYENLRYMSMSSVRIINGRVERLLFTETDDGIEITLIEINQDHYGTR